MKNAAERVKDVLSLSVDPSNPATVREARTRLGLESRYCRDIVANLAYAPASKMPELLDAVERLQAVLTRLIEVNNIMDAMHGLRE